ncbi:hypothetical protein H8356DRAFT_1341718 [Neocallimastix lanati (nom. inval.)]|nr:hypothetical protein H8356DRAFT_1341718 [Neocallimastix sp. JGI-2020a]
MNYFVVIGNIFTKKFPNPRRITDIVAVFEELEIYRCSLSTIFQVFQFSLFVLKFRKDNHRLLPELQKAVISTPDIGYSFSINKTVHIIGVHIVSLLINCKLRRSQSSLHTARRCIPNVPTYISNDHEHQNGTINSSLVGVIIGDWKFYNHQGLCFNSKRSIRDGLMDITCGLMISQDRNLIRLFVTCIALTDWTNMANLN